MKSSLRVGLGLFGLIVFGGFVSAGVFILFGTQLGVYALVAIVPTLVVVGGLWVRRTVTATGTDQTQFTRRRAREVGEAFVAVWERRERMRSEYPSVAGDGLGLTIDTLVADLDERGIEFDPDSGSFTLGSMGQLEDINSLGTRVEELEADLERAFVDAVDQRIDEIESALNRIDDLVDEPRTTAAVNDDTDWETAGEELTTARSEAVAMVDSAAEAIQATISAAGDVDRETVESRLADAREQANDHDFDAAVTTLLDARDAVRREGDRSFSETHRKLGSLLDTVAATDVDPYLDPGTSADVSEIRRSVADLDDAMELSELTEQRKVAISRCLTILSALEEDLDEAVGRLERADVPAGYYTVPDAHDREFVEELRQIDDLSAFETAWQDAVVDLTTAIDDLRPKVDVVDGYDQVSQQIESTLQANGRVDGSDLPVREHEEQFLGLYYREHPESVAFDIDEPSLTAKGDTEDYDLTVTVQFEHGGPDREVTVALESESYEATQTITTPLVGTTTFEAVPFGEYTVRATPADTDFGDAGTSVLVDADTDVSLDLPEVTLRDELCDGIGDESREYLDDLQDRFEERFEEEGYLSTEMSYRVDEQYVPCLLVLWSERTGYGITKRADGTVVVYDDDTLRNELENVVAYNLEDGESIELDELRERFLTAPVPDEVLTGIVEDGSIEAGTVDDDTLRRS